MEQQNNENNSQYHNGTNENNASNNYYQPPTENGGSNQQYYQPPTENAGPNQQHYQPPVNNGGFYQPPTPPKKKNTALKVIAIILGIIVALFVALFIIGLLVDDSEEGTSSTETTSQTQEEDSSVVHGVIDGNKYSNSFAGFGIDLPDSDWTFVTGDELYGMLAENDAKRDEEGNIYLESDAEKAYYDMLMMNNTTGTNLQIMLSDADAVAGAITSEELYINNMIEGVTDSTTKAGDIYTLTIAGEEYKAVDVDYTSYGTTQTFAVRKVGGDFVIVALTLYSGLDMNGADYYFDMFYKV